MVSEPTKTRTIEMTIATMGRLMKNFDMGLLHRRFCRKRLGVYAHARTHFLNSLSDDAFTGFQPLGNDPSGTDAITHRHGANVHFAVAVHDRNLIGALKFRHGALRYQQPAAFDPDD